MTQIVTKKDVREFINSIYNIYSTANLKASGEYRISIPWSTKGRYCAMKTVDKAVWKECDVERDELIRDILRQFPSLKGHVRGVYHIGACIYLSLRFNNAVFDGNRSVSPPTAAKLTPRVPGYQVQLANMALEKLTREEIRALRKYWNVT